MKRYIKNLTVCICKVLWCLQMSTLRLYIKHIFSESGEPLSLGTELSFTHSRYDPVESRVTATTQTSQFSPEAYFFFKYIFFLYYLVFGWDSMERSFESITRRFETGCEERKEENVDTASSWKKCLSVHWAIHLHIWH